jgi:MFS family permease
MKALRPPRILLYLIAVYFMCGFAVSGGRVAASLYCLHAGLTEGNVGILYGLYGLLPMFFSVMVGRLTDRIGPLGPIRVGCGLLMLAYSLVVFAPKVGNMFVMAACCGVGMNIVTVAGQYAVGKLQNGKAIERVRNYGWFSIGQSSGNILGPLVAGFLIDGYSFASAFLAMAMMAACAFACVVTQSKALGNLHTYPTQRQAHSKNTFALLTSPSMRRIYIIGIMLSASWDIFLFLIPIIGHRLQFSASTIGSILSSFAVGTFMVRLLMPMIAKYLKEWEIMTTAISVIVCVYLLLPLTHTVLALFVLGFVFGMAVGCSQPNMLSLLHTTAPKGQGAEAVGFRQMLCNASGVIVPGIFGVGAASLGVVPIFWSVAVFMAMALPLSYREQKKVASANATTA